MSKVQTNDYESAQLIHGVIKGNVIDYGDVENKTTGVRELIQLPIINAFDLKTLLIGGGLMLAGAAYIAFASYKHGADDYISAEFKALTKAGIM